MQMNQFKRLLIRSIKAGNSELEYNPVEGLPLTRESSKQIKYVKIILITAKKIYPLLL